MSNNAEIKKFVKERNEAFLSLDKDKIVKMLSKYDIDIPRDEKVFWAGVHKARIEVTVFSEEVKNISRKWLIKNGFYPGIN